MTPDNQPPLTAEDANLNNLPYYIYGVVFADTGEPVGSKYIGVTKEMAFNLVDAIRGGPLNPAVMVAKWRFTNDVER